MTKGSQLWTCQIGRPPKAGKKYTLTAWLLEDPVDRGYVEVLDPDENVVHSFEVDATAPNYEDFQEPMEHLNEIVDMLNAGITPIWPDT